MIARAARSRRGRLRDRAACASWAPHEPVDVLVSNATLQWVPGHLDLLPPLVDRVSPGGWLAFQVPGNFAEPSHVLLHDLAAQAPYAEHTAAVAAPGATTPSPTTTPWPPSAAGSTSGRRRTSTCSRAGPGLHLDLGTGATDPAGASGRPAGDFETE